MSHATTTTAPDAPTLSPRRRAANRANAQKSTGPRTPAGKRAASQNAHTHLAFCADLVLPGESADFFRTFRNAHLQRLCPMDVVEMAVADRVVSAAWRLRRLQSADAALNEMEEADLRERAESQNQRLERLREQHAEEYDDRYGGRDDDTESNDDPDPLDRLHPVALPAGPLTPGLLIATALRAPADDVDPPAHRQRHNSSPFERLLAAEHRLQGMHDRAMRQLRQLQHDRRTNPPTETCPFLEPDPGPANQPTPDEPTPDQIPDPTVRPDATERNQPAELQNEPTCQNDSPETPPNSPRAVTSPATEPLPGNPYPHDPTS